MRVPQRGAGPKRGTRVLPERAKLAPLLAAQCQDVAIRPTRQQRIGVAGVEPRQGAFGRLGQRRPTEVGGWVARPQLQFRRGA